MTPPIALTLTIIVVAVILFATEKLRVDVIALLVLLTLALTGLVGAEEVFNGFSSPAVVTVWAVYIVSGGLFRTGVADMLGQRILRVSGHNEPRLIAIIMLTCGIMSAFMNNIGATAMLLPAVAGISRRTKIPLSRLLIPLAFSSLLGGNMTLIGTPPNILATNILAEYGLPTFGFFDFTPMGIIVFGTGVLYMILVGRHLLPRRQASDHGVDTFRLREYVSEFRVLPDSPLAGTSVVDARLGADYDLTILTLVRDDLVLRTVSRDTRIEPNDVLMIEGAADNMMRAQERLGLVIETETEEGLGKLDPDKVHIVEATLSPRSAMVGRSLRDIRFRQRYGFTILAIQRHGKVITQRLRDLPLEFGDTLLLQGPRNRLGNLQKGTQFLVLEPVRLDLRRHHKAPLAIGIMGLVLLLASVGKVPISLAMVIGAVLMVVTNCLTMDEAYQSIEWRSVFLIAGMLPLGMAMESTGTARFLADIMVGGLGALGPLAVLAGIYVLAGLITQPMSNAAATVLIVPIAIDIALGMGANPQPFVLAAVIGASTSFLTPVGHQANVLVFGPGGYRFSDFTRVGALLNLVILAATLIFLPLLWPLF